MANKTISDLTTELLAAEVDGDDDLMEIDDVSAAVTKKVKPRSIVQGGGGVLADGTVPMAGDLNMAGNDLANLGLPFTLANAANADDLVNLSRTFAGAGRLLTGTMGAATTDDAARIKVLGTGRGIVVETDSGGRGLVVQNTISGDGVAIDEYGIAGEGGNNSFTIYTPSQLVDSASARDIEIIGGQGGQGVGSPAGAGADVIIDAGPVGIDLGGGPGVPGNVIIRAGEGSTVPDGTITLGSLRTSLVYLNGEENTVESRVGKTRIKSPYAGAGALELNATSAAGTITGVINGTTRIEIKSTGIAVTGRVEASGGVLLNVTSTKTANYAIAAGDDVIPIDSSAGGFDLTLPAGAPNGTQVRVKDMGGALTTNLVGLWPSGADTIEGASSYPLEVNRWAWLFVKRGTDWMVM